MLRLNTIFEAEGLDPARIKLIRHKDPRFRKEGKTVFDIWSSDKVRFEKYQSVQSKKNAFDEGGSVASFVVSNSDETLFVGFYGVESRRAWRTGDYRDPLWKDPSETRDVIHELRPTKQMSDYISRLVIEPWKDAINIVKRAVPTNPHVLEIRRQFKEPNFPDFSKFHMRLGDLRLEWVTWQRVLSLQRGVYLLAFADGQKYVGSATGESATGDAGFWQRWKNYLQTGDGGNVALQGRDARDAMVCILETARLTDTRQDILDSEYLWQRKLGTRTLGDK